MIKPTTKNYPRRFIAGAACSKCNEIDVTVMYSLDNLYQTECIKCGYTQKQGMYNMEQSEKNSKYRQETT